MSNSNWILKNGSQSIDCASFPYAFRTAFGIVRKATENQGDVIATIKELTILGPPNHRGDRRDYSYSEAIELAKRQDLLTPEGTISSREFKKK
jgi:hypothetical protein